MSLLTPDTGLLFWMLITFGIVVLVLAKYGFPVILRMVEKRNAYIEESLIMAEKARTELESVKADSERIIDQARKAHIKMLGESNAIKEQLFQDAKEKAGQEATKLIDAARQQIQNERDAALREIRKQVAELSVEIAEKILQEQLKPKNEQEKMIDRLLDQINISKS
ncbi:MAG: F0F1 ATP synthase subunit B [Paludibacter sp.]|jgi:F-type H+-transporting ATPase subunit b|nr:F0F1 ATP synthase subunit B [Paludibacter sp.]